MTQLLHALADLAGTMPDDPHRLTSVRARARVLRRRRLANRGAAASGAMAVALAGVAVSRGSSGADADTVPMTTSPSASPATGDCTAPSVAALPEPGTPGGPLYQIVTLFDARITAVDAETVTVDPLEAHDLVTGPLQLTVPSDVELYDGDQRVERADLAAGQIVRVILLRPEGVTGWTLAALTFNPLPDTGELPPDAVVDGNTVTLPSDC